MLTCAICSNLQPAILTTLDPGKRTSLFFTIGDLRTSVADTSCLECTLIWNVLSESETIRDDKDSTSTVEVKIAVGKPCQVSWSRRSVYLEIFSRSEDANGGIEGIPHTIGTVQEVAEVSSSDSCFDLAASWLKTCVDSHTACRPENARPLPTRVIDVGTLNKNPVLVETHGNKGQYVALSYCWGNPLFHTVMKTTTETYQQRLHSIEFNAMPKTLQDAVTITRRLGLQYLWIDALCIIQGDMADWEREASKMCEVYSNAYLTIAGDNSPGNSHGIFNKQSFGQPPKEIKFKTGVVYVRQQLGREHDNFALITRGPQPEPMNCRGWCLQEAVLSNRLLRYTSKELFWECNEWRFCECGHASAGIKEDDEASSRNVRRPEMFGVMDEQGLRHAWGDIIMRFTERQLGFDEDKLPALAGLAKQFARAKELAAGEMDQFLAGHWRKDLVKSLLWNVEDDRSRIMRDKDIVYRRPKVWRAPTWSWPAVEGPVAYLPLRHFRSCLEIVEVSTVVNTLNLYGSIKEGSGRLVVKGKTVHGFSVRCEDIEDGDTYEGYVAGIRYAVWKGGKTRTIIPDDGINEMSSEGFEKVNNMFSCLLVGKVELPGAGVEDFFLVLREKPGYPMVYERIGVSLRRFLQYQANENSDDSVDGLFMEADEETITIY
ncbi:hypothetical protein VTL71DRAFT_2519 [Oculimacula yallundae]|uniref:Heterokaryon incompatibility domain-containing protein n=1 Tax=Oculimacula yallundae TaxID=86028 RepID=A0ABR4C949_9HELO